MPQFFVIFTCCYSSDTPYANEAFELRDNARSFGLDLAMFPFPNQGAWARNCAMKPAGIQTAIGYYRRPVVYLDVDARIRQYPSLFRTITEDIAVHYRHGVELLSSVIFINNTPAAHAVIERWDEECQTFIQSGSREHCLFEQQALQRVLEEGKASVYRLPPEYCAVFDDAKMGTPDTWVISQHQASRRLARTV